MKISTGKKLGNGKFSNLAHFWLHTWLCLCRSKLFSEHLWHVLSKWEYSGFLCGWKWVISTVCLLYTFSIIMMVKFLKLGHSCVKVCPFETPPLKSIKSRNRLPELGVLSYLCATYLQKALHINYCIYELNFNLKHSQHILGSQFFITPTTTFGCISVWPTNLSIEVTSHFSWFL